MANNAYTFPALIANPKAKATLLSTASPPRTTGQLWPRGTK